MFFEFQTCAFDPSLNNTFVKKDASWSMGINQFSDLSEAELASFRGFNLAAWANWAGSVERAPTLEVAAAPKQFDWRGKNTTVHKINN